VSTNQAYKYTGKPLDMEKGLNIYYFGARYYNPAIGRWLAVDPMAGKYPSVSPYVYANDRPIDLLDLDGNYTVKYSLQFVNGMGYTNVYEPVWRTISDNFFAATVPFLWLAELDQREFQIIKDGAQLTYEIVPYTKAFKTSYIGRKLSGSLMLLNIILATCDFFASHVDPVEIIRLYEKMYGDSPCFDEGCVHERIAEIIKIVNDRKKSQQSKQEQK
jgi:RHS repeat-associated protein